MNVYQRGTVWVYHREFTEKGVTAGTHPCIIVSPDEWNATHSTVIAMPCTSKKLAGTGSELGLSLLLTDGNVFPMQLTTIPKYSLRNCFGQLPQEDMEKIDELILAATGLANSRFYDIIRDKSDEPTRIRPNNSNESVDINALHEAAEEEHAGYRSTYRNKTFPVSKPRNRSRFFSAN